MKKTICMLLAALLLLTGCQSSAPETTAPEGTDASQETTAAPTESAVPEVTMGETLPDMVIGGQEGESLWFQNPGKIRIDYTGDRRYVHYITSVDELPAEEGLEHYDEAFFEEYALVIVVETVGSGSLQLEIGSISVTGDTASVCLERTMPGDVGTTDMATWMLWAEVEKDLNYTWTLENASQMTEGEKY